MSRNLFCCENFSLEHITTMDEVNFFAQYLVEGLKVNVHPDDNFADYLDDNTLSPSFTVEESYIGNKLMEESFDVCKENDADIYEVMLQHLLPQISKLRTEEVVE